MIDLIVGGIQHSNLFAHMPLFDEIYYEGTKDGKVRKFKAIREEQPCRMLFLNVIRKDEDVIWDGLEDMIKRSVAQAGASIQGVYTFDLLTIDIHREVKTFNLNELATTIANHARKLKPGEVRLVKYSTLYGLLQKMSHQHWGKIVLKTSIEVFKDKPSYLDLLVKQLIANFDFSHEPGILLLHDHSQNPLFDASDAIQKERLRVLMDEQIPKTIEFLPEVYVQDKNALRELLSGSVIK